MMKKIPEKIEEIFGRPDDFDVKSGVVRAKSKKHIPVVLSRQEIDQIISKMRQPSSSGKL